MYDTANLCVAFLAGIFVALAPPFLQGLARALREDFRAAQTRRAHRRPTQGETP